MAFTPYIHFQGTCAEAMAFYKDVFGGTDLFIMRYRDAPAGSMPPGDDRGADLVMHATLTTPAGPLMAGDVPPGMTGAPQQGISVSWDVDDLSAGKAAFDALSAGGQTIMPWGETFWADGFGMVKDKFGTHWMISGPGKAM